MGITDTVTLLKALADQNRLNIVRVIATEDEVCACKIAEDLEINQSTLSHHMKVLCSCGLVASRKEGKWAYYSLDRVVLSYMKNVLGSL